MYTAIIYFKNVVKLCRPKILFNLLLKMRLDLAAVTLEPFEKNHMEKSFGKNLMEKKPYL